MFFSEIWQLFLIPADQILCKGAMMNIGFYTCLLSLLVLFSGISNCNAKVRLSSLHGVPDADFLNDRDLLLDMNCFYFSDSTEGSVFQPAFLATYSVINWVNFEAGYAGGATLGLKARVLDETNKWQPSIALGVRNCITNRELYYYQRVDGVYTNELFLAISKSIEHIRLRLHLGLLSIPDNKRECFNPYIGFEKYFGGGVYTSVEVQRRDHSAVPSLFTSWRFGKSHFELSAGVISIDQMLLDKNNNFNAGISSSQSEGTVRPGIYLGLRFHGNMTIFDKPDGFLSLEDRVNQQYLMIDTLRCEIDILKKKIASSTMQLKYVDSSVAALSDSSLKSKDRYRTIAIEKLNALRVFYSQEPFEPELVKKGYSEIVGYRNEMVPTLFNIAFEMGFDKKIRTLAVSVLGEIGTRKSLDALIDILSQSKENEIKIEALICLGKNKETRAIYLMKQLSNDPNDALAFTAAEVLKKIELQTGMKSDSKDTLVSVPPTIPETKINKKNNTGENVKKNEFSNINYLKENVPIDLSATKDSSADLITEVKKPAKDSILRVK